MDQLKNYADNRLINGCVYCGGFAGATRDHVPSRVLLESPFPDNLPVVEACPSCNNGFSQDEEYLACLIECVIAGSTDPKKIRRKAIAKTLSRSNALRERIEKAKRVTDGRIEFATEPERIRNVVMKLARAHVAYELGQQFLREPNELWCQPLALLSEEERDIFDSVRVLGRFGEVGSRGMQRLMVIEAKLQSETSKEQIQGFLVQDWVDVQEDRYRYMAIDDVGGIVVMIVIADYLACKVVWNSEA